MITILAGKVLSVRTFETQVKSGPHEGEFVERTTALIDCSGKQMKYGDKDLEQNCVSFLLSKGDPYYKEIKSMISDQFVQIKGVVTESNGYTNVNIHAIALKGDKDEAFYAMPVITEREAPKAKTTKRIKV